VDALLIGTGGAHGWPEPGCRCASCLRASAAGRIRSPSRVLVDGTLAITPGQPPAGARQSGHVVTAVRGGWDITSPAGSRLLVAGGPGLAPEPPDGTRPFDLALLDLLANPSQLGWLRARSLVRDRTTVAAIYADHRVSSEPELARRCALWGAAACEDGTLVSGPSGQDPALPVRPHRTLIVGGARSGKSREAELRLSGEPAVTYLAAGPWASSRASEAGLDAEWVARVAAHRTARPAWWHTEESLDLAGTLRRETGALLIDGIGTWLAAIMDEAGAWADPVAPDAAGVLAARIGDLVAAWRQTSALVAAVTDQVGEGLVPTYQAGRMFRDQLGWLNQRMAAESDLVLQVVAGRVMTLPA
jgi:adenosylcobinamide kinase / adenosylcobinamide-phosphate guanylyltransferase